MKTFFIFLILLFIIPAGVSIAQDAGIKKYGNVAFADSVHHKYPIDTDKHIRIAWAFIHQKSHASKYTKRELAEMRRRIRAAAEAHGIHLKKSG